MGPLLFNLSGEQNPARSICRRTRWRRDREKHHPLPTLKTRTHEADRQNRKVPRERDQRTRKAARLKCGRARRGDMNVHVFISAPGSSTFQPRGFSRSLISFARNFAILPISFMGTGFESGKRMVLFTISAPASSSANAASRILLAG